MQKFLLLAFYMCAVPFTSATQSPELSYDTKDLAYDYDDRLLIFATLEGNLVAIEQETGLVKWKIKDKPVVKVPTDTRDAIVPVLLPDPRDGSLYLVGDSKEPLKKLPFTIPELVASSPCRSSDGILYTGKKKDSWFMLDSKTGQRQQILGWDRSSPTCPLQASDAVYVGQTEYSIMMVNTKDPSRKWNITFYDYTATPMGKEELSNYELVHFTSSSSGRVISMDKRTGSVLWDSDLGSPVISAYLLDKDGLLTVPFTSLANHTLSQLIEHFLTHKQPYNNQPSHMKLYPTLYIGEHPHGLYALPSLVDQNLVTINPSLPGLLLLEGPGADEGPKPYLGYLVSGEHYKYNQGYRDNFVIFLGHYNVPDFSNVRLLFNGRYESQLKLLTDASNTILVETDPKVSSVGVQTEPNADHQEVLNLTITGTFVSMYNDVRLFVNMQENKGLKLTLIVLVGCIIAMFWYLQAQVREFQQLSQNGSKSSQVSSTGKHNGVTAVAEEMPDGLMQIGKIKFNPEELLGKGCEGTFVYRGEFDQRNVAVKRLLPECFNFADREVALLRESDAHPNVVRYYCTEQDRMFRYIALELCQATLSDYVQGKCDRGVIEPLEILRQACAGLAHLHSLDIVHRDIKPHNVLLSMPDKSGRVRAMISDFGLCKKLQFGRVSFSRKSGVTGTDGWIAPEMLTGNGRTTCAVDLFSLGCLFYYVLSEGSHPFGEALRRQANILCGESTFDDLKGPDWQVTLQKPLIAALISSEAANRPPCNAVLSYPIFWDSKKILAFYQDVSDRVEKIEADDPIYCTLERNGYTVVRHDWRIYIHEEVARDLRKYRTYRGESVRDLLRALRNKKHHFRELSEDAQQSLGESPEAFTNYWNTRFPLLLMHTWLAMQCVSHETTFSQYYNSSYSFADLDYSEYEKQVPEEVSTEMPRMLEYKRRDSPKKRGEAVGLYRNLNGVDLSDIRVNLNEGKFRKRTRLPKQKSRKSDEPLTWAVTDGKMLEVKEQS